MSEFDDNPSKTQAEFSMAGVATVSSTVDEGFSRIDAGLGSKLSGISSKKLKGKFLKIGIGFL